MKSTLFDLSSDYRTLFDAMVNGESDALTRIALEMSKAKLEDKIDAYAIMINQFKQNIARRTEDIKDLQAKNKRDEASMEYLQSVLEKTVQEFGVAKDTEGGQKSHELTTITGRRIICIPSKSVQVTDDFKDEKYGGYKVELTNLTSAHLKAIKEALNERPFKSTFVPDKKAIGDALAKSVPLVGAEFVTNYRVETGLK